MSKDYFATQQWVEERLGAGKMVIDIVAGSTSDYKESVTLPYVPGATMAYIQISGGNSNYEYTGYAVVKNLKSSGNAIVTNQAIGALDRTRTLYSVDNKGNITIQPESTVTGNYRFAYKVTYYA